MPELSARKLASWATALNQYSYHVDLRCCKVADQFPGYFETEIDGDRDSTISFENHFREHASLHIEVYFEVVYWKLYSQENRRENDTEHRIKEILKKQRNRETDPAALCGAISDFVEAPDRPRLKVMRNLLGIPNPVLAVTLTFPSFFNPEKYPMVDKYVAKWVNAHLGTQSANTTAKLTRFASFDAVRTPAGKIRPRYTSLRDIDFDNYMHWVYWCREVADRLTLSSGIRWRARDVEMAVFTASRNPNHIVLEIP